MTRVSGDVPETLVWRPDPVSCHPVGNVGAQYCSLPASQPEPARYHLGVVVA